ARTATVAKMAAAAGTATTAPAQSGASAAKPAAKPAGVKVGGRIGFAMMALAAATTAVTAVTGGSGQAEASQGERQSYKKADGSVTTGTPAQIAAWNRQKGGN